MKKMLKILCLSCLTLPLMLPAQESPKDTLQWVIFLSGNNQGFIKQWKNPDGSYSEWFQFNDRGRGDSTVSKFRVDDRGFITHLKASGVDYYKKPVKEKFSIIEGMARWKNNIENDSVAVTNSAHYVGLDISAGTSYKYYFNSPNKTVKLLPSGTSALTVLDSITLENEQTLRLISTKGSGLVPNYAWIDENDNHIASPGTWFSRYRMGFEHLNDTLLRIQQGYEDTYFQKLAQQLRKPIEGTLAITNARLFNPKTGNPAPNSTILIEGGKIKAVTQQPVDASKVSQILDVQGKFVMPGLWDMHVHYSDPSAGMLHLACGVTNVRDLGNGEDLIEKKEKIDAGIVLGPRIQGMSGFIDGAGEFAGPIGFKITSAEEGVKAVEDYAAKGYQQIKLYSSVKPEWVAAIATEAKRLNLRVSGHIPAFMLASEAVDAGYNEIQHMNMLFLNFYGKEVDTRTPARFTTVAEQAAFFDFNSEAFKTFVKQLKDNQITIDPTISIFEGLFTGEKGKSNPAYAAILERLPLTLQRFFKTGSAFEAPKGEEDTYRKSFANMVRMIGELHKAGITIVPGTDAFAGFTLHRELENYVSAGISPAETLRLATLGAAQVAGKDTDFGTIEVGKVADLIVIDGDPLEDVSNIRRVVTVIKGNEYYETHELLGALSIAHFK